MARIVVYLYLVLLSIGSANVAQDARSLFPIMENGKWGLMDWRGKVVVSPRFDWVEDSWQGPPSALIVAGKKPTELGAASMLKARATSMSSPKPNWATGWAPGDGVDTTARPLLIRRNLSTGQTPCPTGG